MSLDGKRLTGRIASGRPGAASSALERRARARRPALDVPCAASTSGSTSPTTPTLAVGARHTRRAGRVQPGRPVSADQLDVVDAQRVEQRPQDATPPPGASPPPSDGGDAVLGSSGSGCSLGPAGRNTWPISNSATSAIAVALR